MVRGIYTAIIESIESGEVQWQSNFSHYDVLIPKAGKTSQGQNSGKSDQVDKNQTKRMEKILEWYCRDYQKGECNLQARLFMPVPPACAGTRRSGLTLRMTLHAPIGRKAYTMVLTHRLDTRHRPGMCGWGKI